MSQELISTWLGLQSGEWPPSHYRLLGLKPGENDANLIEERVHQRLDMVRRYQMMYPDQATEAMNLLAQAFVCLTDPATKKVYDLEQGVNGAVPSVAPSPNAPPLAQVAEPDGTDADEPVVVLFNPAGVEAPPVRQAASDAPIALVAPQTAEAPALAPMELPAPVVLGPSTDRHAVQRALYKRIAHARKLLAHWNQVGKYVATPKRRLTRPAEAADFMRQLTSIRELLQEFPGLLGQAGQAGYHILTLAQMSIVPTFQTYTPQQRELLSRDWSDGQKVLEEHRVALRAESRVLRRQNVVQRAGRTILRFAKNRPGAVLATMAVLALIVVLFRTFVFDWLPKVRH